MAWHVGCGVGLVCVAVGCGCGVWGGPGIKIREGLVTLTSKLVYPKNPWEAYKLCTSLWLCESVCGLMLLIALHQHHLYVGVTRPSRGLAVVGPGPGVW